MTIKLMPILNARRSTLNAKKGFTLIELLVVIAIIGLLASFTVASFTSAQQKSRDARRKSDLDAIKKALELAKLDTPGAYFYPSCETLDGPGGMCFLTGTKTTPDLSPTYIKNVPLDPKTGTSYIYYNGTNPGCSTSPNTCTTYTLIACLENGNDTQGVTDATNCPTAPQKAYTITPN